tara:strand:+ start:33504 stop:33740 length:237 start_codon:yes stop_codon:yes gene_type:complete
MIDTILDAAAFILEEQGETQSPYWLASQMMEGKLWRASEHDDRAALEQDIAEHGDRSRFVEADDDEYALRSWMENADD